MKIANRIKQINRRLGIDLTNEGRTKVNYYLRMMIAMEYQDMSLCGIGKALNVDHSAVQYYRNRHKHESQTEEYKYVMKCVIDGVKPMFLRHKRNYKKKRVVKPVPEVRVLAQKEVKAVLMKDLKSPLWNKDIKSWSPKDWKMFDKIAV